MRMLLALAAGILLSTSTLAEDEWLSFVQADRLEFQAEHDEWLWDLQGWFGGDLNKFWWKTEGHIDGGNTESAELQFLYSKAISPYFDLQIGIRHDVEPDPSINYAVIGIQGLAPQWFEIDAAAFISDEGDVSARFETEYDLLLTQRLVLQPRFELNVGELERTTDLDLRLRYEIRRKIAPYIGINWHNDFEGADDFVSVVAGARFWF